MALVLSSGGLKSFTMQHAVLSAINYTEQRPVFGVSGGFWSAQWLKCANQPLGTERMRATVTEMVASMRASFYETYGLAADPLLAVTGAVAAVVDIAAKYYTSSVPAFWLLANDLEWERVAAAFQPRDCEAPGDFDIYAEAVVIPQTYGAGAYTLEATEYLAGQRCTSSSNGYWGENALPVVFKSTKVPQVARKVGRHPPPVLLHHHTTREAARGAAVGRHRVSVQTVGQLHLHSQRGATPWRPRLFQFPRRVDIHVGGRRRGTDTFRCEQPRYAHTRQRRAAERVVEGGGTHRKPVTG